MANVYGILRFIYDASLTILILCAMAGAGYYAFKAYEFGMDKVLHLMMAV